MSDRYHDPADVERLEDMRALVASTIRAGAATTHGTMALKFFEQA